MAKEYIERNAAIEKTEAFCDVFVTQWTDAKVLAWIRNLPAADVVEVVRCGECKHFGTDNCALDTYLWDVIEDGFCSYGERRDNNATD